MKTRNAALQSPLPRLSLRGLSLALLAAGALLSLAAVAGAQEEAERRVAVTIDDLPLAGGGDLAEARRVTLAMVAALKRFEVPASGFVTGANVMVDGELDERLDLLRHWQSGGVRLENHSFSHRSFQRTPQREYQDDVVQGQLFPQRVRGELGEDVVFYRHPFNHTGPTAEARTAFEAFLGERGLRLAPFTVEHADYVFETLYRAARDDDQARRRLGEAYLEQLDTAFDFAEALSRETFGREIPQVFLIHANSVNADHLVAMLERLATRGYRFISLTEAMADPAYATPDVYVGATGISWLHRWRVGLDLENRLRDEPDPPRWILDAYRKAGG